MSTCNYTIGSQGCALTSFAMLASLYGSNDNPGEVNNVMGSYACPFGWDIAETRYNLPSLHYSSSTLSDSLAKSTIAGILQDEGVCIVGMKYGTGGTHFVLARGYNTSVSGDTTIRIYDPSYTKDYSYLSDYLDSGYTVNRIIFYSN